MVIKYGKEVQRIVMQLEQSWGDDVCYEIKPEESRLITRYIRALQKEAGMGDMARNDWQGTERDDE